MKVNVINGHEYTVQVIDPETKQNLHKMRFTSYESARTFHQEHPSRSPEMIDHWVTTNIDPAHIEYLVKKVDHLKPVNELLPCVVVTRQDANWNAFISYQTKDSAYINHVAAIPAPHIFSEPARIIYSPRCKVFAEPVGYTFT
jgi:hypothetical protein